MQELAAELAQQHSIRATVIAADLGDPKSPGQIWNTLESQHIQVDMLINNAGYGVTGTYLSRDWTVHQAFMQVMLRSVAELCHRFMPAMAERGWGRVINVASLAGFLPGTNGHTQYAAVKAWMIKFSESLSLELADQGVLTCASCPGFTYSEFHDVTGTREQMSGMPKWMWMTAEDVVQRSLKANQKGKAIIITGGVNRFIAFLTKILPRRTVMWLLRKNNSKFRKVD